MSRFTDDNARTSPPSFHLIVPASLQHRFAIPSLKVSFAWMLAGSLTLALSQWCLIVLFAKLGNAAMVGHYAYAAAIAFPIALIGNLSLRAIFVNDFEGRFPFARMLGARYLLVGLAWAVLLVICALNHAAFQKMATVFIVGTALLLDSLSESYYSMVQKYDRMERMARSQIMRSLLSLTTVATILYLTRNLVYAVCGMLAARSMTLLLYDSAPEAFRIAAAGSEGRELLPDTDTVKTRFAPQWDLRSQFQMIWLALPLGFVNILVSFNSNIPRYIIENYLGPRELGIYSALNYIPQAAIMISTTLASVTFARLSKFYFNRDLVNFRGLLGKNVLICAALGAMALAVSLVAGRQILAILYRPEYAAHWDLLMWLVATGAVACVAACVGSASVAASQFRQQIPLFLAVTSVSAGLSFLLIPPFGLYGAAAASLASMVVQFAGACLIVNRALAKRRQPQHAPDPSSAAVMLASES